MSDYSVDTFVAKFPNDFVYLADITWNDTTTYFSGDEVYYSTNGLFYIAMSTFSGIEPTSDPSAWQLYDDSVDNYVTTSDIQRAMDEADCIFNPNLAGNENQKLQQYMYLTAHFLCLDKRMIATGISGESKGQVTSVSVGSVSESYQIPEAWTSNMMFFPFTTTSYGLMFLSFVTPSLVGNVAIVQGATLP